MLTLVKKVHSQILIKLKKYLLINAKIIRVVDFCEIFINFIEISNITLKEMGITRLIVEFIF
jgi:hypothetical protein